jgi:hypothetical protein
MSRVLAKAQLSPKIPMKLIPDVPLHQKTRPPNEVRATVLVNPNPVIQVTCSVGYVSKPLEEHSAGNHHLGSMGQLAQQ